MPRHSCTVLLGSMMDAQSVSRHSWQAPTCFPCNKYHGFNTCRQMATTSISVPFWCSGAPFWALLCPSKPPCRLTIGYKGHLESCKYHQGSNLRPSDVSLSASLLHLITKMMPKWCPRTSKQPQTDHPKNKQSVKSNVKLCKRLYVSSVPLL